MAIYPIEIDQFFICGEIFTSNPRGCYINQTFTISESFNTQYILLNIRQVLGIGQSISLNQHLNITVNQRLSLYEQASKIAAQLFMMQNFHPYQQITISPTGIISQLLNLRQTIYYTDSKAIYQTYIPMQVIKVNHYAKLTVHQTFNLDQNDQAFLNEICISMINYVLDGPNSTGGNIY